MVYRYLHFSLNRQIDPKTRKISLKATKLTLKESYEVLQQHKRHKSLFTVIILHLRVSLKL